MRLSDWVEDPLGKTLLGLCATLTVAFEAPHFAVETFDYAWSSGTVAQSVYAAVPPKLGQRCALSSRWLRQTSGPRSAAERALRGSTCDAIYSHENVISWNGDPT